MFIRPALQSRKLHPFHRQRKKGRSSIRGCNHNTNKNRGLKEVLYFIHCSQCLFYKMSRDTKVQSVTILICGRWNQCKLHYSVLTAIAASYKCSITRKVWSGRIFNCKPFNHCQFQGEGIVSVQKRNEGKEHSSSAVVWI